MKKIICIFLSIFLTLALPALSSCNVENSSNDFQENESPSVSEPESPLEPPGESTPAVDKSEAEYNFEKGYTSIDLARQLKPLMTVLKTIEVLESYPRSTSSIGSHSYTLTDGGTLLFFYEHSRDMFEDMLLKNNEALVVKAVVIHDNDVEEILFDVTEDQTLKSDMIIYDTPMLPYNETKKVQPYMTDSEVVELIGKPRQTVDWFSPYEAALYTLEDRRIFYIYYSIDVNGSATAVYAWIYSDIQSLNEVLFDIRNNE